MLFPKGTMKVASVNVKIGVFGVFEQEELKDQTNSELFEELLVNPRKYSNF